MVKESIYSKVLGHYDVKALWIKVIFNVAKDYV